MPTEYENFLNQSNIDADNRQINQSAPWIGEDTDDEASQLTDDENEDDNNNLRAARARFFRKCVRY